MYGTRIHFVLYFKRHGGTQLKLYTNVEILLIRQWFQLLMSVFMFFERFLLSSFFLACKIESCKTL